MSKIICLSYDERMELSKEPACPNCKAKELVIRAIPLKHNPILQHRIVIQCKKCGYWSDFYDCWRWYPKECLEGDGNV